MTMLGKDTHKIVILYYTNYTPIKTTYHLTLSLNYWYNNLLKIQHFY